MTLGKIEEEGVKKYKSERVEGAGLGIDAWSVKRDAEDGGQKPETRNPSSSASWLIYAVAGQKPV